MALSRILPALLAALVVAGRDVPPPLPYAFSYQAGRYPGHSDRVHSEVGDGSGVVRGSFSYVDPDHQVRTVDYVADEQGFYPSLSHPVADTPEVAAAKNLHAALYDRIAEDHALRRSSPVNVDGTHPIDTDEVTYERIMHLSLFDRIAAEHAQIAAEREAARTAALPPDSAR